MVFLLIVILETYGKYKNLIFKSVKYTNFNKDLGANNKNLDFENKSVTVIIANLQVE